MLGAAVTLPQPAPYMSAGKIHRRLLPIRTRERQVPWTWVALVSLPWAAMNYFEQISNVALMFKLHEFVTVPVVLTLAGSLNQVFNIVVGAFCCYASDHVWTRIGRRKPFLIVGWATVAVGCLLFPGIGHLGWFLALLFFYELLRDLASPYGALCYEIVPPPQRGRANAAFNFARNAMSAVFFGVLIGRWDDRYALPWGGHVSGQEIIFWTGSLIAGLTVVFVVLFVQEEHPRPSPSNTPGLATPGNPQKFRSFLLNVFANRQWRALYVISAAQIIFWIDLGNLSPFLYTQQWGFSKQDYGYILAVTTLAGLFVFLPLGGWMIDRFNRLRLFQALTATMTLKLFLFYLFFAWMTPVGGPSFHAVLILKLVGTGIGTIGVAASTALIFDYVPRNSMGTVTAGISIVRGVVSIVVNAGIGLWVTLPVWLSTPESSEERHPHYDYAGGYLYLTLCGCAATLAVRWFARRDRQGNLLKLGTLETRNEAAGS